MYFGFMFGWLVGFVCAFLLVELMYDSAERKGGYNYYDDCWEEVHPAKYEGPPKPPKQPLSELQKEIKEIESQAVIFDMHFGEKGGK
jgi:hypothetical protein